MYLYPTNQQHPFENVLMNNSYVFNRVCRIILLKDNVVLLLKGNAKLLLFKGFSDYDRQVHRKSSM